MQSASLRAPLRLGETLTKLKYYFQINLLQTRKRYILLHRAFLAHASDDCLRLCTTASEAGHHGTTLSAVVNPCAEAALALAELT
jgi:hypothetical protein